MTTEYNTGKEVSEVTKQQVPAQGDQLRDWHASNVEEEAKAHGYYDNVANPIGGHGHPLPLRGA